MKNKICIIILIFGMLLPSFCSTAAAGTEPSNEEITVVLNGDRLIFDVAPITENDRTLVPFRGIFEALGCTVSWQEETQTALGTKGGQIIKLPVGNQLAKVNGQSVYLDQPAVLKEGRTLVPLRFVAESLGAKVEWEEESQTVSITGDTQVRPVTYLFTPSSFEDKGTWFLEAVSADAFPEGTLKGGSNNKPENTRPAVAQFLVTVPGEYQLWVRSRDYAENGPGTRFFNVEVNGADSGKKYGTHGAEGFAWADGGKVVLKAGINVLKLVDSADFYGRCDAVLLTQDLTYRPSETYEEVLKIATPFNAKDQAAPEVTFPAYAREMGTPTEQAAIENQHRKVIFYTVPTSQGTVVQNEILNLVAGEWIVTKKRSEDLGFLLLSAEFARPAQPIEGAALFDTAFTGGSRSQDYYGRNVYCAGKANWLIPDAVTVTGKTARLHFTSELVDFQVTWSLEDEALEPLVQVSARYKEDGVYSIGVFEGEEQPYERVQQVSVSSAPDDSALRPDPGIVLSSDTLEQPWGVYTLWKENGSIQKGIRAEAAELPESWGICMRGPENNFRTTLFAPVLGGTDSAKKAGESHVFQYRVISQIPGEQD